MWRTAEPLEQPLHDAVLGCERAAALHDAAVLELRKVALHAPGEGEGEGEGQG